MLKLNPGAPRHFNKLQVRRSEQGGGRWGGGHKEKLPGSVTRNILTFKVCACVWCQSQTNTDTRTLPRPCVARVWLIRLRLCTSDWKVVGSSPIFGGVSRSLLGQGLMHRQRRLSRTIHATYKPFMRRHLLCAMRFSYRHGLRRLCVAT